MAKRDGVAVLILVIIFISGCTTPTIPDTAPSLPAISESLSIHYDESTSSSPDEAPLHATCSFTSARQASGNESEYRPMRPEDREPGQVYFDYGEPPENWVILELGEQDWVRLIVTNWTDDVDRVSIEPSWETSPRHYSQVLNILEGPSASDVQANGEDPLVLEFRVGAIKSGEAVFVSNYHRESSSNGCASIGFYVNPGQ